MKKAITLLIVLAMILILSGCKTHVRLPFLWFGPDEEYMTFNVAIAVGPDGAKHLIRSDCNEDFYCRLTYEKTYNGEESEVTHVYSPASYDPGDPVPTYIFPDIAVTEDGTVYITWHYNELPGA